MKTIKHRSALWISLASSTYSKDEGTHSLLPVLKIVTTWHIVQKTVGIAEYIIEGN